MIKNDSNTEERVCILLDVVFLAINAQAATMSSIKALDLLFCV